ncbi:MAG TPA: endonuclease/exonuclease/phosphatase family protein [Actinomycetota bacterium]|nr:endonuclease/exonuclease/phosphatase family protein [Actinomycetota bacterium]
MPRLRVLAYNVHGFRGGVRRVARTAAAEGPDVALLNEAKGRFTLQRFARATGMGVAAHGLRLFGGVPNAVLLRPPWRPVHAQVIRFSRTGGLPPRGAIVVRARRAGVPVTLVTVHLGLSDAERPPHARELTDALAGMDPPIVLGGDLNEGPQGKAAAWIADRLWDAWPRAASGPMSDSGETFPAREPRARIDYLFVSEEVRVERCWLGATPDATEASDHLPLFADVVVGEE